jgi:hypothetical protein
MSITTYNFPQTFHVGNWILFNIYMHQDTRFNEGEWRARVPDEWDVKGYQYKEFSAAGRQTRSNVRENIAFTEKTPERDWRKRPVQTAIDTLSVKKMLKIGTSIGLYLPENISFSYGVSWNDEDLGVVRSIANSIGSVAGNLKGFADNPSFQSFRDLMGGIKDTTSQVPGMAIRMAAGMASLAGIPADKLYDKHQKSIVNRHTELHFNGVNLRQFEFNFKFYPKDVAEAKQIRAITDTFKFHMHPELSDVTGGWFMKYPSQFELAFMRGWDNGQQGVNHNVARIGRAALTSCQISHGEGEYVPIKGPAFSPNNPTDWYNSYTEMKLAFQELTVLTKDDILEGM